MPKREIEIAAPIEEPQSTAIEVKHTAVLLLTANVALELQQIYQTVLEQMIDSEDLRYSGRDKKEEKKFAKKLKQESSQFVLTVIWKESDFVDEKARSLAGVEKSFQSGQLSVNALAKEYVAAINSPSDLNQYDRFNAFRGEITTIVNAAQAYGLIDRNNINQTEKPIVATDKLHDFMCTVYERYSHDIRSLLTSSQPTNPSGEARS